MLSPRLTSLADYFSLGYLYLLILGVTGDSIYYGRLGVNIISYSSVLDVLLGPITHLTGSLIFPLVVVAIPAAIYGQLRLSLWVTNRKRPPAEHVRTLQVMGRPVTLEKFWLGLSAWVVLAAFVGFAFGGSQSELRAIAEEELRVNRVITLMDHTAEEVRWIGNNSNYAFYVRPGEREVTVAPTFNNLRSIKRREATTAPPGPVGGAETAE